MKTNWLHIPGSWHIAENAASLKHSVLRHGQLILFFLALILLFLWYNSLQSRMAEYLNGGERTPKVSETQRLPR